MRVHWIRYGLIVIAAVGAVVAALSSVPGLVNVEAYKPGLVQAVREATGRELVIDGPMRLRVFPVPGIGAGTVHFANAVGAKGAQMIDVRWVSVRPAWGALLQGKIEVGTLTLYQPTIVLETDAKGVPNWQFEPGGNVNQPANAPSEGFHLAVGRLQIVKGTITYTDPSTKRHFSADDVTAGATVHSFDGPFEIDGSATVNGVPLKLDLAFGEATSSGHRARLNLQVSSGTLDFTGGAAALALDSKLSGHLAVKTGLLSDFVDSVASALGAAKPTFDTSGAGRFAFDGDIEIGPDRIAVNGFDVSMGKDEAKGSLALALRPVLALGGHISLSRLDLGKWIKIFSRPVDFTPDPVKAATTAPTPEAAAAKVTAAVVGPSPWSKIDADVTIDVAEALYNDGTIRDLSASIDMKKGVVTIPRLKASMPGDLAIDADAGADSGKGTFKASTSHLRDTLHWLGIDTADIPRGRLETVSVEGKLAAKAGGLDLSDGTFKLDGAPGTVGGTLSLKGTAVAKFDVGMDRFDLDAYMPKPAPADASAPAAPPPATPPATPIAAKASDDAPSVGLKLDIKKLLYRGETLKGVAGVATWQSDILRLEDIKVADLLGAKLGLKGLVGDFGAVPRFNLGFTVAAPDTDRLLDYAGLPKFLNGKIGAGTAAGTIAGTREAVTVRGAAVHFLGTDARATGTLAFTSPATFDFSSFNLQTPEASKLVAVASGQAMGGLGPIVAAGRLQGSSDRSIFTGDLTVRGSQMNGTLDAILGKRPKLAARLKVPRTLDIDSLLGIEDDSAPAPRSPDEVPPETRHTGPARKATPKPINLTAMRSFDATLVVSAKAMSMAALTVDYADLNATLTNGVFKINKLTGQFYKGAVDFSGTIDASGPALRIQAAGSLLGIHVDELLRGTVGDNVFGKSSYRITVDGKIDARNIKLTGQGISAAELRESIAGATTIDGVVRAGMAGGAQSFAKFATGIGGIFSETLGFDSAVLGGFINRENAVSGGVALGGGTVTLQNQIVRGNNATAVINGRNRMADGTTDTTIRLTSGKGPYIAKMTGKLSSPNIDADRP